MALYQVNVGDRILAADINQFFNILKGVAASGESVTFVYNAAPVISFQPSSDPVAGTEAIQIKNSAGAVQASLTFDGKLKAADGVVGTPSIAFESDATTGIYKSAASTISFAVAGTRKVSIDATGLVMIGSRAQWAQGAAIASAATITPGTDGNYFQITGTTGITAIAALQAGTIIILQFAGALTLTHNAASLILRTGANVTTAAGDVFAFISEGSGNWRELWRLTTASATGGTGGTPANTYAVAGAAGVATTFLRTDDVLKNPVWDPNILLTIWNPLGTAAYYKTVGTGNGALAAPDSINLGSGATSGSAVKYLYGVGDRAAGRLATWSKVRFFNAVVQPATSIATNCTIFAGLTELVGAAVLNFTTAKHIGFKYVNSGNWVGTVSNGSTESTVDTGIAVVLGTTDLLAFTFDGTTVTFYVNGVNKGTLATNLPTGAFGNNLYHCTYVDNGATAADRELNVAGGCCALAYS